MSGSVKPTPAPVWDLAHLYHFVDAHFVVDWIREFTRRVQQTGGRLTRLDAAIGDADHGDNLNRGLRAVLAELSAHTPGTVTDAFGTVGATLTRAAGGVAGTLYGTLFLRLSTVAARSVTLDAAALALGLRAARDGIVAAGKAVAGDKTFYDALTPAVEALDAAVYGGLSLVEALEKAATAAEDGRDATVAMQARRGRATTLGAASVGHQDPGATSMALLFRAAADVAAGHSRDHL